MSPDRAPTERIRRLLVGNEEFCHRMLDKHLRPIHGHAWYFEGMSKEVVGKVRAGFEARYGKGALK